MRSEFLYFWIILTRVFLVSFSLPDFVSHPSFLSINITSKILQWPTYTILLGDFKAFGLVNQISDFKATVNSSSDPVAVASIKELTTREEILLTSRKLHFVFLGEPREFILLISKIVNPFHHAWFVVIQNPKTLQEWLNVFKDLQLDIDSDVFLGISQFNSVQILEVFKICPQCPYEFNEICEICNLNKYERRKNLKSFHLNVVAVDVLPFMTSVMLDKSNGIARVHGGLFGTLFSLLANELNITYTLRILNGYKYGAFKNGSWNGMIGYLSRNEADMTVSELSIAPDRLDSVDFTTSFDTVGRKIYIRKVVQGKNINWKFYSAPFSSLLHSSVIFWIILMTLLLWIVELQKQNDNNSEEFTLKETFWIAFSCICQKGAHIIPTNRSSRLIFVVFFFTFVIIFCAYSATLISQLAVSPPVTVPFRDLQDFVNRAKNWQIGPIKGDLMQIYMERTCPELLKSQKNGRNFQCELFVQLWTKVIEGDRKPLPLGFKEGLNRVLTEKFAFIATSTGTRFRIANDLNEKDSCSVLEMDGDYISSNLAFGLRKDNPYRKLINYKILQIRKSGILKRLQKEWLPQRKQCLDQNQSGFNDATIYDVGVLPLIWLFGFFISFFILLVERLIHRKI